ncbi:MAG: hypothetical protein A3J27_00540 [Candidatus Tectomicrobia bacterium RIFCSPLOWO2_12_FULL_69_37]|nr:MAG: hypothetical protein A3J27_00540 [Candidatus Tectomicrobia bacterium RIFCSPLOWO2_12_FULL_69_37]
MKTGKAAFFSLVLIAALAAGCESGPPKESVSGTILLSPSLPPETRRVRHLFIYLEPGQGGPPFAIQRLVETELPYRFVVTPDDVFARGQFFTGQVRVRARLLGEKLLDPELEPLRLGKLAGALMTGSFEGVSAAVAVGARDVEVVISQAGKAEVRKVAAQKPAELPPSHPPIPQGQAPQAPRPPAPAPQASSAPQAPAPPAGGGGSISGTIVLAPPLAGKAGGKRAVFLIARGEQPGPPLAVARIADPTFPLAFTISQANVMTPGVKFEGRVRLVARVDADGSAGPPQKGDLEGQAPAPVAVGSTGVRIVVDKEY